MSRQLALGIVVALAGCQDYGIGNQVDKGTGSTTTPDPTTPTTSTPSCDLRADPADSVDIDAACQGEGIIQVTDPWNLKLEWNWTANASEYGSIVMPAVGNLTDDDGDGVVTERDNPDVAFTTWTGSTTGRLVALNGDGTEIFTRDGFNGNAGVAIADVDGDGWPEVIAFTSDNRVAAVDRTGKFVWTSSSLYLSYYPQPTVADLDNDGQAEVIFDTAILDGATGAVTGSIANSGSWSWRTPVVADLDQDGKREIILGNTVARPDGSTKWTNPGTGAGNFAAVADVDGDPDGEVLFVSGSTLYIQDADGSPLGAYPISGTNPGPPSVADFDGDGQVEIAIPANYTISVYELDGTQDWSMPIQDGSGLAGCSGYDVNGDGAYEVLYADETDFWIFDGATGKVLYDNPAHDSGTVWEYPVIADVDNDGSAEIIVASNTFSGSGFKGVTVFGHAGSGWPKSGPTWGTHDFALTNLNADGSVPTNEIPSWQTFNVFRARPTVDVPGLADPFLLVGDPCVTECGPGGVVQLAWQVGNSGAVDLSGSKVRLYTRTQGEDTEIANATFDLVPAGDVPKGGVFEVDAKEIHGADKLVVAIDPDGIDCNPGDTEVVLPNPCD